MNSNEAWAYVQAARRRSRALMEKAEREIEARGEYVDNPKDSCLLDREKLREGCP